MKLINVFLSFILKFFHILFTIIAFVGPLVTNNVLVLAFLFAVNAFVIFCWVINGGVCFLSPLEQKLDGVAYKYSNGVTKNFMAVCLDKILKNELFTFILITIIPVLNIFIICIYNNPNSPIIYLKFPVTIIRTSTTTLKTTTTAATTRTSTTTKTSTSTTR